MYDIIINMIFMIIMKSLVTIIQVNLILIFFLFLFFVLIKLSVCA